MEPDDVESFALVSKRIYSLATPFVEEHTRLKQQYSKTYCPNHQTRSEAADLFEEMLLTLESHFTSTSFRFAGIQTVGSAIGCCRTPKKTLTF